MKTTMFLRLLAEKNKAASLLESCAALRSGEAASESRVFEVVPESFRAVPGAPFAYWVSEAVRALFEALPRFESAGRVVRQGLATADDFRFVRGWWEIQADNARWPGFAKGGAFSPFYADVFLVVNWAEDGAQIRNFVDSETGRLNSRPQSTEYFGRAGLTWPLRSQRGLGLRAMPSGCVFGHKGPAAFAEDNSRDALAALLSLANSRAFGLLVSLQMAFGSYEVGVIQKTPVPSFGGWQALLAELARRAWSLKRTLDTTEETSHAFLLPAALRTRLGAFDPPAIEAELARIQAEIDEIAFVLYGFSASDRASALAGRAQGAIENAAEPSSEDDDAENEPDEDDEEEDDSATPLDQSAGLLCWAVGVAFGRFDVRLATGERMPPPEPDPFDPLPAISPGMRPDGAAPFHPAAQAAILVDDPGHPHDLARLVEAVLERVQVTVAPDVRRWLRREFFDLHFKRYSKSRRKAPIYWPLATPSGSYTLWLYYPALSGQTLYAALNDFIEPKLRQTESDLTALRNKGNTRTRDDERRLEALTALELELHGLRGSLLSVAPTWRPNHDDGVQISAAPLAFLFRQRGWQRLLNETWAKLARGDYDWAHLAFSYWPQRVREKCRADKSLAIAHGLEALHEEAPEEARPRRQRRARNPPPGATDE